MTTNKEFYRSIGNMLAENLNGCAISFDNDKISKKYNGGFNSLKSIKFFLSNDFIIKYKKHINNLDGKIKSHLSNDLKRYEFFDKNLGMVVDAIEAINKCIKLEEDNEKPKELINLLNKSDGLISRIFEHLISVLNDGNIFKNKDIDNMDLINEQKICFKKYRVKIHEKNVLNAIMNINCNNNEDVKIKSFQIINSSCDFLTEEAIDLFLY